MMGGLFLAMAGRTAIHSGRPIRLMIWSRDPGCCSMILSEAWIAFLEFVVIVMGRVASFIAGQKGSHGG